VRFHIAAVIDEVVLGQVGQHRVSDAGALRQRHTDTGHLEDHRRWAECQRLPQQVNRGQREPHAAATHSMTGGAVASSVPNNASGSGSSR
jgi:hypothetical protein